MIPKLNRGRSFKKLTAYLMHDKREYGAEAGEPHPDTAERVGFTRTMNFIGDAAQGDPRIAARIMAATWKAREAIKQAAGSRPGGTKAEASPVYHGSLSWAKSQRPDKTEMTRAVELALAVIGLGVEKGYQTYLVEHTDTEHMHVHFVVNLVHPETGKQANPHRDQPKLQKWAREYEKQHGQIFCHDRERKYAAIDQARQTPARAAFNDNAQGRAAPASAQPDKFGRSREREPRKNQQRPEWQARKAAGNDNRAGQEAAARLKSEIAAKYAAVKAGQTAAFTQRTAETSRFYADRKAGRDAIFEKYKTALDAIWKPQPGPKQASPDRSRAWQNIRQQQEQRQTTFDKNEKTALGRIRNALTLAEKGSLFRTARLAVNAGERRRLFERGQRAIVAKGLPREERQPTRPAPKTPEPKRVQAERLKAMRTKELTEFARDTTTKVAAMKARHAFQITGEKDARAILGKDSKAAWQQHEATHGPAKTPQHEPAPAKTGDRPEAQPERNADRFGRSRDRQPRAPRRREATTGREIEQPDAIANQRDVEAENSPVEAGYLSGQFSPPANDQAPTAQPEAAQQGEKPKAERQAAIDAERERQAAHDREFERDNDDPGRTL